MRGLRELLQETVHDGYRETLGGRIGVAHTPGARGQGPEL
ncbi:hypothetical protein GLA29479_1152 [Lysobacter antibioticus]|uniref:Uncharacterized protein n=1 Tax=Lysobacter antibioticus TaxID=84531 RepID=A0A0S2DTI3_LYSAN|nr:hypothetical protein GLA29479_1152 [Lysobacter antibioticus]ALN80622.1 hypothetical protein LA76x_2492 [Lysobacter antibioticus]